MMVIGRIGVAALLCFIVTFAVRADEPPPVKQIFLAHTQRQDSGAVPAAAMAAEFKRQVEVLGKGRLKVGIFPAGQLGGNRDMASLVAKNVVQTAFVTVGGVAPFYPPIAAIQVPFALDSNVAADAVFDGPFGRRLGQDMERRTGMMVLGYGDGGGFYAISNSQRAIRSPKDMEGLKIRT
ncbi:MAG: TRAP transporter substrate-binding protein DctP, partial [Magnetospirillum sp.]|nr:TRAP transporter substrate-binding protein DctP [Magnetospirillum sp.]